MTVTVRRVAARPVRTATETWAVFVDVLFGTHAPSRAEAERASGVAAALIAQESLRSHPAVLRGAGPRVRVYALYDEDALDGDAAESPVATSPESMGWEVWLPCPPEDLGWAKEALNAASAHVLAYDHVAGIPDEGGTANAAASRALTIDPEAFLNS